MDHSDLLKNAVDLVEDKFTYANYVGVSVSDSGEMTLDFYFITSDPRTPDKPVTYRQERVVLAKNAGQQMFDLIREELDDQDEGQTSSTTPNDKGVRLSELFAQIDNAHYPDDEIDDVWLRDLRASADIRFDEE